MQHKERRSINDSFEKFAEQQRYSNYDYMRADQAARGRNSQKAIPPESQ
jgi:hypothetical protein